MNVKQMLVAALCALALPLAAQAQGAPQISPTLHKMLGALPIADVKDDMKGLVAALKKTQCGGGLTGCYMTKSSGMQLYFLTDGRLQQTFLLVVDKKVAMPKLLHDKVQGILGGTSLQSPIISISTTDYVLDNAHMPPDLQAVVRNSYFNVNSLQFAAGVQLAARADLGGAMKLTMEALGVKSDQLMLRGGVVMPIPTDLASGAGSGAGLADAMAHGDTMKKSVADALKPGAFVEFQLGPGASIQMVAPRMKLTDATFFINNESVFGYKGYATFDGTSKPILLQFQTPLTPAGAMDLLDFSFRMATPPTFTMQDGAKMLIAMQTPDPRLARYGGGFVRNIEQYKQALLSVTEPLATFQLRNPVPAPEYRFGDSTRPFPYDDKYFNVKLYGPLADGGPLLHLAGDVVVLGQRMATLDGTAAATGLHGKATQDLSLRIGPLGKVTVQKMAATVDVDRGSQLIRLKGNVGGQSVEVTLNGATLKIDVPANCVNPFEIRASVALTSSTNLADVFEGQGGASVDPSGIAGCTGEALKAALNKITNEYKALGGYPASAAANQLNQINAAAQKAYQDAKNIARDAASKSTTSAMNAFNDAGNAFRKLTKKKKHRAGPDPKFAASVFDWDDYYDDRPDVVAAGVDLATHWRDSGIYEGRSGSREFSAGYYWNRYLDVQQLCPGRDLICALNHWLNTGIYEGRQANSGFSVADYLDRYPDLQNAFGREGYADALNHWINDGKDNGRNGNPNDPSAGPVMGPARAGGWGGSPWDDRNVCAGKAVDGIRVGYGKEVNSIQFRYGGVWAGYYGANNTDRWVDIALDPGEGIVRVDFRSGDRMNQITYITTKNRVLGPYGGGGGNAFTYVVTPGQRLGCVSGRSGGSIDQLLFYSTGPR